MQEHGWKLGVDYLEDPFPQWPPASQFIKRMITIDQTEKAKAHTERAMEGARRAVRRGRGRLDVVLSASEVAREDWRACLAGPLRRPDSSR